MPGLFDRPPPPKGLFEGIFAGMGRGLTNPGGFFVNEGAPVAQALGNMMLSPFVQANQAMPWGGNDPSAIGIDPQTGSIDPSVMVPWATDVAGTVTAGAGMAPPVLAGAGMGIRAYHGSPHDFERFDLGKIGTGEGAQAYGHGLYFAENPAVAGEYKKALASGTVLNVVPETVAEQEVISRIKRYSDEYGGVPDEQTVRMDILNDQDRAGEWFPAYDDLLKRAKSGKTYEVDIDASPDEFLDWDKPLSEQPKAVQEGMKQAAPDAFEKMFGKPYRHSGAEMTGGEFWEHALGGGNYREVAASEALRAAGIKGIRYLDEGSRGLPIQADQLKQTLAYWQGEAANGIKSVGGRSVADEIAKITKQLQEVKPGTSNYVVFDDKTISILKKYGLAGLTAGGAGAAMLGGGTDQAQAAQPPWMTGGRF